MIDLWFWPHESQPGAFYAQGLNPNGGTPGSLGMVLHFEIQPAPSPAGRQ